MLPLLDLTHRLPERACELRPADVDDITVQIGTAHSWPSGLYALSEERLPGSAIGCSLCCCYIYSLWTMLSASHDLDVAQDTKARMNLRGNSFRYKRIVAGETRLLIHCFMLPPLLETLVCYEPKALLCKLISLISVRVSTRSDRSQAKIKKNDIDHVYIVYSRSSLLHGLGLLTRKSHTYVTPCHRASLPAYSSTGDPICPSEFKLDLPAPLADVNAAIPVFPFSPCNHTRRSGLLVFLEQNIHPKEIYTNALMLKRGCSAPANCVSNRLPRTCAPSLNGCFSLVMTCRPCERMVKLAPTRGMDNHEGPS
ncbi:hypothetical protein HDV57DRAFT_40796 [Trichoderma longibrachiatum]